MAEGYYEGNTMQPRSGLEPLLGRENETSRQNLTDLLELLQEWWNYRVFDDDYGGESLTIEANERGWKVIIPVIADINHRAMKLPVTKKGEIGDWYECRIDTYLLDNEGVELEKCEFVGYGGLMNLADILSQFFELTIAPQSE